MPRCRKGFCIAGALVALAAVGLIAPGADAVGAISMRRDGDVSPIDVSFGSPSSVSGAIALHDVAPGRTSDAIVFLAGEPVRAAALTILDVRDIEDGCMQPELHGGDTSCTPGEEGELSTQLTASVLPGRTRFSAGQRVCTAQAHAPLIGGRSFQALDGTRLLVDLAGPGSCLILRIGLPDLEDNNVVQGDSVRWKLAVTAVPVLATDGTGAPLDHAVVNEGTDASGRASGEAGLNGDSSVVVIDGSVGGKAAEAAPQGHVNGRDARLLPFTGSRVELLTSTALAALGLGALLLWIRHWEGATSCTTSSTSN